MDTYGPYSANQNLPQAALSASRSSTFDRQRNALGELSAPMVTMTGLAPMIQPEVLALAARGWRVFPVKAGEKEPPLIKNWPDKATRNPNHLQEWAKQFPECNWAVATGRGSGVFVLDVDGDDGRTSLATLEAQYGPLPVTLVSRTGRDGGGKHLWFKCPSDRGVRNSASKLGKNLDLRADGGYAIIPPSIHPSGRAYDWIDPEATIADASWLLDLITKPMQNRGRGEDHIIPDGRRNNSLASIAGSVRRRGSDKSTIETELLAVNAARCQPPLSAEAVAAIAASISRYGPRPKPDTRQSLPDFVREAISKNGLDYACRSKWRSALFVFTQLLKGRADLGAMDVYQAAKTLDVILAQLSTASDPWQSHFGDISEDARAEFIKTWDSVQSSGGDALAIALSDALAFPLKPLYNYSSGYCIFLSIAGHLQRTHPNQAIVLPVERLGMLLACHRTMIGNYRRFAEKAGILLKTAEYVSKKRATEYRFALDLFDWRTGEQRLSFSPEGPASPEELSSGEAFLHSHHTHQIPHDLVRVDASGENEFTAGQHPSNQISGEDGDSESNGYFEVVL